MSDLYFVLNTEDLDEVRKAIRVSEGNSSIRAVALLMRNAGSTRAEISRSLDITPRTVTNICSNYTSLGLERALNDDPRPGRPIIISKKEEAKIVAMVCADPPEGFDRWTLDLIQKQAVEEDIVDSISKEKIRLILQEHDLKPWRQKMWCIPKLDEEYIDRMEKILDLYDTPDNEEEPLVCIDEKAVFLSKDKREAYIMEEGSEKKVDYEYERKGSANVFVSIEPYKGDYTTKVTERRTAIDFAIFLKEVSDKYEKAKKIKLVMDNLNTHKLSSLVKTFGEDEAKKIWDRFDIYYTPKHGSWLNQAEIAIGMFSRQCLGKTRIPDVKTLQRKTESWTSFINEKKTKINWTFSKYQAREKMGYNRE